MKTFLRTFVIVMHLLLLDAITKELAAGLLKNNPPCSVIPGFFNLTYVENRGCAWGMFQGRYTILAMVAAVALAFFIWKRKPIFGVDLPGWRGRVGVLAERLLYAGIIGNLIDRVFRGYVIDFLDFYFQSYHFPCFNVADMCITLAAVGLIILTFFAPQQKPHLS